MGVHIQLEHDRELLDSLHFGTFSSGDGTYRRLFVKLNGRPFYVWHKFDTYYLGDPNYLEALDTLLVRQVELLLEKLLATAIAKLPETDLTQLSTEEIVNLFKEPA